MVGISYNIYYMMFLFYSSRLKPRVDLVYTIDKRISK